MNTRREFKFFNIAQYNEEADYLRRMHRSGWRLTRVTFPGNYCFEQCEPEDVVYQLDYNQEGAAHRDDYLRLFADCGWEYLFDFVGFSYFRKPAAQISGEESIFCDDASRLAMVERIFKGRLLPLLVLFLAVLVPQTVRLGFDIASPLRMGAFVFLCAFNGIYLGIFAWYGSIWLKMKKRIGR